MSGRTGAVMEWAKLLSQERLGGGSERAPGRIPSEFQRDFDRIVFSSAFRRLHDKTQVFPMPENDHVHSRLTHSLEVSCVGRSLGTKVGAVLVRRRGLSEVAEARDFGDIVAAACLAHDIGNPPFGHSGEDAFRVWFRGPGACFSSKLNDAERRDFEWFEGNAQGFRLLTRLQMAKRRGGMRLTFATLGAFCKYPRESLPADGAEGRRSGKKYGFFQSEKEEFRKVAGNLGLIPLSGDRLWWCRHPLVFLVEAADDICYQILDLEDGFRLGKVPFSETRDLLEPIASSARGFRPPEGSDEKSIVGYLVAQAISRLVFEVTELFLEEEEGMLRGNVDRSLIDSIESKPKIDAITDVVVPRCYRAPEVMETEIAGYEVIGALLEKLMAAAFDPSHPGHAKIRRLMPRLFPDGANDYEKILRITDFVSGMTDSYAVTLYRRLSGHSIPR